MFCAASGLRPPYTRLSVRNVVRAVFREILRNAPRVGHGNCYYWFVGSTAEPCTTRKSKAELTKQLRHGGTKGHVDARRRKL